MVKCMLMIIIVIIIFIIIIFVIIIMIVILNITQATTFWILPLLQRWSGEGEGGQPHDERLGRLQGVEQAMARSRRGHQGDV